MARSIALELRRSQQKRIAAQMAPDGSPFAPRRPQGQSLRDKRGSIRRRKGAMFVKLRTARWLKATATAQGAEVGFVGRVARLARVHQEGLSDQVAPGGRVVRYAARRLLGFSSADREMIRDRILDHLSGGQ